MSRTPEEFDFYRQENWYRRARRDSYITDRELDWIPGGEPGYDHQLGSSTGKSLTEMITEKLHTQETVSIYDVGCGEGRFLLSAHKKWGNRVLLSGSTAYPYHLEDADTVQALIDANIEIKTENIEAAGLKGKFDFIISVYAFSYLFDPLTTVQTLYSALRKNGVVLIYPFTPRFEPLPDVHKLSSYLTVTHGATALGGSLYLPKRKKTLHLPVEYNDVFQRRSASESWQINYRWVGEKY